MLLNTEPPHAEAPALAKPCTQREDNPKGPMGHSGQDACVGSSLCAPHPTYVTLSLSHRHGKEGVDQVPAAHRKDRGRQLALQRGVTPRLVRASGSRPPAQVFTKHNPSPRLCFCTIDFL